MWSGCNTDDSKEDRGLSTSCPPSAPKCREPWRHPKLLLELNDQKQDTLFGTLEGGQQVECRDESFQDGALWTVACVWAPSTAGFFGCGQSTHQSWGWKR